MKHTPGPWWIDDDMFIASGHGEDYKTVASPNCMDSTDHSEEIEANARLIAAAPELLENLIGVTKALSRLIDQYNPDSIEAEWIGNANDTILKAS